MMYPRVFAQKVGHTRDNLQKDVCGFTIKPQKGPAEKGRKQAVFGGMNMELRSQEVRTLAPENDPLKMGMN